MATNALAVVRRDITPGGRFTLLDAVNRSLRAINHAVVAFEAHAATHAALGFGHRRFLVEFPETVLEVVERAVLVKRNHVALVAVHIGKVAEE